MSPLAACTHDLGAPEAGRPAVSFLRATGTAVAVLGAATLPVVLTAVLAVDLQRDLRFGSGGLGIAAAAFWAGAAASSLPAGWFVDRFGAGRAVHAAAVLSAATALAIGLVAGSLPALVVLLAGAGAALALAAPGISALVGRQLTAGRRGLALGIQQSGPPLAMLLAGLVLPVVAQAWGWRAAFCGAATLVIAAGAGVPARDCAAVRTPAGRPADALGLAAAGACGAAVASAGITFLVPFAEDRGLGDGSTGLVLITSAATAIAVRIGAGRRSDVTAADPLADMGVLLGAGALGFLVLAGGGTGAVALGAVLALGAGWGWAGLFVLAAVRRQPGTPGAAVAAAFSGVYAGAIAGPVAGGAIVDGLSYTALWIACACGAAMGCLVLAREHRRGPAPVVRFARGAG